MRAILLSAYQILLLLVLRFNDGIVNRYSWTARVGFGVEFYSCGHDFSLELSVLIQIGLVQAYVT